MAESDASVKARVGQVACEMFGVYQNGWREAYRKEQAQSAWEGYKLFLLGGGSLIPVVSERLRRSPWYHLSDRQLAKPGFPTDLFELPADRSRPLVPFMEEPTFLLVAYGLSWLGADVPPVNVPTDVPPWRPAPTRRERADQDELYPK